MCYRKGNQDNPTLGHLRDQSVFITWGGPEEFRGGLTRNWVAKRGGVYSLEDFVEGGGGSIAMCNKNKSNAVNYFVFYAAAKFKSNPATILNVFRCLLQLKDIDIAKYKFHRFRYPRHISIATVIQRALFMHADL